MAKIEKTVRGDFDWIVHSLHQAVMSGSASASYEDGSEYSGEGYQFSVRVYDRYSAFGGNRVSMTVTVVGGDGVYHVTAITSGGSQAMFFKINTVSESSFLDTIASAIDAL